MMEELEELRTDKKIKEVEIKFKEEWIKKLERERETFLPQLVEQSKTIGYLEAKNESLEDEKQRLLSAPIHNATRIIEPQSIDDSDNVDIQEGEAHEPVTV